MYTAKFVKFNQLLLDNRHALTNFTSSCMRLYKANIHSNTTGVYSMNQRSCSGPLGGNTLSSMAWGSVLHSAYLLLGLYLGVCSNVRYLMISNHLFGQFCNFQISASKNSTDFILGSLEREYCILCNRLLNKFDFHGHQRSREVKNGCMDV